MEAMTWGKWWKEMYEVIKHQYSKEDISAIEGLLHLNWNAATKAAEERFTSQKTSSHAMQVPCKHAVCDIKTDFYQCSVGCHFYEPAPAQQA